MLIFAFMLLAFDGGTDQDWAIDDLEIFNPLTYRSVNVGADGIYIVDSEETTIRHYSLEGEALSNFGQKGSGPGEFPRGLQAQYFDGKVYANGFFGQQISVFSADGTFEKTINLPERSNYSTVANGWVAIKRPRPDNDEGTAKVVFVSKENLEESKELTSFHYKTTMLFRRDSTKVYLGVNPSTDAIRTATSADRKTLYVYQGLGNRQILKIDLETGQHIADLKIPFAAIPFDEEWGNEKYEERKGRNSRPNLVYEKAFPENFALVSNIRMGPKGNLWAFQGNRDDLAFKNVVCFSPDGKKIDPPFSPKLMKDMVGFYGDYAYFCEFDEDADEPARIIRRKIKDLK